MKTLNLSTGSFDQDNTFTMLVKGFRGPETIRCSLHRDYAKTNDGIYWIMQKAGCLKAVYTDKDREETARLNEMEPLRHGEIVKIDDGCYRVKVNGNYSDAAVLEPVQTSI